MANQRLYRYDLTVQRANSATDSRLVPAPTATVNCYRQGATVSAGKTLASGADTIDVYDTGGIRVDDAVLWSGDLVTAFAVTAVSNNQISISNGDGSTELNVGDRLLVNTGRPNLYDDPSGLVEVDGANPGVADATGSTTGSTSFYSPCSVLDVVVSGGGLVSTQIIVDLPGHMPTRTVRIEDFGGLEASIQSGDPAAGNKDNKAAIEDALVYLSAIGGGTLEFGEGTYYISAGIAVTDITNPITVVGKGKKRTTLYLNNASGSMWNLSGTTDEFSIQDLTIERSATSTVACFFISGTNVADTYLRRVRFNNAYKGFEDAGKRTVLEDCSWEGSVTTGIHMNGCQGGVYTRPKFALESNPTGQLLLINGASKDMTVNDFYDTYGAGKYGLAVATNATGGAPQRITFNGGTFSGSRDGVSANAINLAGGAGIRFNFPMIYSSDIGVAISGGGPYLFVVPVVVACSQEAFDITAGSQVDIIYPIVDGVNISNGAISGIQVAGAAADISVFGGRGGKLGMGGGTTSTQYFVNVADGTGLRNSVIGLQGDYTDHSGSTLLNWGKAGAANTKQFLQDLIMGSTIITPGRSGIAFRSRTITGLPAAGTTADVEGVSYLILDTLTGALGLTDLDNGTHGQIVFIRNADGTYNVTIPNSGNFTTNTGATITLAADEMALAFLDDAGVWHVTQIGATT